MPTSNNNQEQEEVNNPQQENPVNPEQGDEAAGEMVFNERECMVVLLNNDQTSFEAVLDVLQSVFGLNPQLAMERMQSANDNGGAICRINTRQDCEDKKTEAENYCQARAGRMHPVMTDRQMYYEDLEFEVRERD